MGAKTTGGEGGIRTPDRVVRPYNGLANRRLQPLGHLSGVWSSCVLRNIVYHRDQAVALSVKGRGLSIEVEVSNSNCSCPLSAVTFPR
jgi:hypothetical protein